MTGAEFQEWLAAMKASGLAKTDEECGRMLGVSRMTIYKMKNGGVTGSAKERTRLACKQLLSQEPSCRWLEWEELEPSRFIRVSALGLEGLYRILGRPGGWHLMRLEHFFMGNFKTKAEAKINAQANFERRVRAELED